LGRTVTLTRRRLADRAWRRVCAIPALRQDAALYLAAGCWTAITWKVAVTNDYREWAAWTTGPYLAAALTCEVVFRVRRKKALSAPTSRFGDPARAWALIALVLFTLLAPLAAQVVRRADTDKGAQAQPEVAVIERAGDRALKGKDPYLTNPVDQGKSPWTDAPSIDARSYFPYLPAMAMFGLVNALPGVRELGDARVELAGFSLLVILFALWLLIAPVERKLRAFQVLLVLPTGALPFVTGGDDLPVLALMFLALVLAQRRRPAWSGLAIGLAAAMKFSAWGLLGLLFFAAYDRQGRWAGWRYATAALVVVGPIVSAGFVLGPHAFIVNALEYPLDLAKNRSPAESPLPGHELLQHLPGSSGPLELLLLGLLAIVGLTLLLRHLPRTPAKAAAYTAVAVAVVTLVAPASRFGYLIYPLNLLVWAALLRSDNAEKAESLAPAEPVVA
jgi:hypothetical protein